MVLSNTVDSIYLCVLSLITTRVYATLFGAETRMAETLPKLTSSRAGYRAHLTKTLNRARDLMEKEEPTEMGIVSLNSISLSNLHGRNLFYRNLTRKSHHSLKNRRR